MLRPYSQIYIRKPDHKTVYTFSGLHELEIESSWNMLTQTCRFSIPSKVKFKGKSFIFGDNPLFATGDQILVYAGYYPYADLLFDGIITEVKPGKPVEIMCEDYMYIFKNITLNKAWKRASLKGVMDYLMLLAKKNKYWPKAGIGLQLLAEVDLGKYIVNNKTAIEVIDELRKKFGIDTFIRNTRDPIKKTTIRTIYAGLPYVSQLGRTGNFTFRKNIIKSDLIWQDQKDMPVKVEAYCINDKTNRRTGPVTAGDKNGVVRTLYHYGSLDNAALSEWATREIPKLKFSGYKGKFEAFGSPWVQHGDTASIIDPDLPDRNGNYLIKKVKYSFGTQGYRQEIEIDRSADTTLDVEMTVGSKKDTIRFNQHTNQPANAAEDEKYRKLLNMTPVQYKKFRHKIEPDFKADPLMLIQNSDNHITGIY